MGMVRKERNTARNMGTTNVNGQLVSHMEICCCRSFLKYIHTQRKSKWKHQIIKDTKPQLDSFCCQVKLSESDMANLIKLLAKGSSWKPKQLRLLLKLLIYLHKIMVKSYIPEGNTIITH